MNQHRADLTLNGVFSRSTRAFRESFARLAPGLLVPLAVGGALQTAVTVVAGTQGPGTLVWALASLASFVIGVGVVMVGYSAVAQAAVNLAAGRPVTAADAWRAGRRYKLWGTLWLQGMGVALGVIFCILPGVYFGLAWALAMTVAIEEGLAHSHALSRSSALTSFNPRGGWTNSPRFIIFLVYVATLAVTYLLMGLASAPLMAAIMVEGARGAVAENAALAPWIQWLQVPTNLFATFFQASMTLLASIAFSFIYFDIRALQDADDQDAAVGALGPTAPGPDAR